MTFFRMRRITAIALFAVTTALLSGNRLIAVTSVSGPVKIDGSSTVYPINEAIAEEFQRLHPRARVTIGVSGTGGGMKKFLAKEIDITGASREIKPPEIATAKRKHVRYHQISVAYDGISVVVNRNSPLKTLTMAQLKKLWEPGSTLETWNQLDPKLPKERIRLYGPGGESGTFEFFTKAVNGKARASRHNYTASEDDNVLVRGISQDKYALGYFGFAYYWENRRHLRAIPIDNGKGPVAPTRDTIKKLDYPLARPVFVYTSAVASAKPQVQAFLRFYLTQADNLVGQVGYVSLGTQLYQEELKKWEIWRKAPQS